MTDFGTILQASLTLSGFLIGINAYLPKGLEDEWLAFMLFLVPSPVLFLVTSLLAALESYAALSFFVLSVIVLIALFVGLGLWSTWEKYTEHVMKEKVRQRNTTLFLLLTGRPKGP